MGAQEQSSNVWSALAALFGAGGALAAIVKSADKYFEYRRMKAPERAFANAAAIYEELNALREELGARRALLLYCTNGGGVPTSGKPINVSILYEVKDKELTGIRDAWQQVKIDEGYTRFMLEVASVKGFEGSPSDIEGFLHDLYVAEGVTFAKACKVTATTDRYYFMSARWFAGDEMPSFEKRNTVFQMRGAKIAYYLTRK